MTEQEKRRLADLSPAEYRRELREGAKEGVKELMGDYVREFGWFSLRVLGVASIGAVITFILMMDGWKK
ncbi:MAG: hypothetical protein CMN85_10700 [Spongiibacteraceae bacterium]|nr:hypothetical protein [Spongiibacteraceae bacterium]|tara:strand:+ start:32945 stop:33151 length:207 start_codon:yes stop_codon:yes gene_type:complete